MDQTLRGALESDPSEEEDSEDHVGEEGGEVDDLAGAGDALHEDEIDEDPGGDQTENIPVLQSANIVWKRVSHCHCLAQPVIALLPILLVESSTVLNQKYWVSLESSHSEIVELSSSRGQEAQGREI